MYYVLGIRALFIISIPIKLEVTLVSKNRDESFFILIYSNFAVTIYKNLDSYLLNKRFTAIFIFKRKVDPSTNESTCVALRSSFLNAR